jgi:hypothetical protein
MARTIKKKVIDDSLLFSDDFDEGVLDKIEGRLAKSFTRDSPEGKGLQHDPNGRMTGTTRRKRGKSVTSDDATEPGESDRSIVFSAFGEDSEQGASTDPLNNDALRDGLNYRRRAIAILRRPRTLLLLASVSVLLIIAAGLTYFLWPHPKDHGSSTSRIVRRPIVIPKYEREINFLILTGAPGKKDLLMLDLELNFNALDAYDKFKDKQVLYSDVIYSYLLKQQPPDNSIQQWEKILERDLLENLKTDCPELRLNSISVKNFSRL